MLFTNQIQAIWFVIFSLRKRTRRYNKGGDFMNLKDLMEEIEQNKDGYIDFLKGYIDYLQKSNKRKTYIIFILSVGIIILILNLLAYA